MSNTRRHFLQASTAAMFGLPGAGGQTRVSPNDRIRIATIGLGGMGTADTQQSLSIPGVELAAVCDLYAGRRTRAKELFGPQLFVTADYREVLAKPDIDAVIVAT